jgi:hypothetical protein
MTDQLIVGRGYMFEWADHQRIYMLEW